MRVFRIFALLVSVAALGFIGLSQAVAAGGAITDTTTEHGVTENFVDVVPCGIDPAAPFDITITYNEVDHSTFGPKSSHFTFTQTGTFVAVPQDASLPTYTGHFTMWGGFNGNSKSASGTFTFSLHGTANDGSTITLNSIEHFNVTPGGVENSFSFENCH